MGIVAFGRAKAGGTGIFLERLVGRRSVSADQTPPSTDRGWMSPSHRATVGASKARPLVLGEVGVGSRGWCSELNKAVDWFINEPRFSGRGAQECREMDDFPRLYMVLFSGDSRSRAASKATLLRSWATLAPCYPGIAAWRRGRPQTLIAPASTVAVPVVQRFETSSTCAHGNWTFVSSDCGAVDYEP